MQIQRIMPPRPWLLLEHWLWLPPRRPLRIAAGATRPAVSQPGALVGAAAANAMPDIRARAMPITPATRVPRAGA